MPAGTRIRANNVFGITTDNPLGSGVLSFNSAGLEDLPAITLGTQHAVITLDPLKVNGDPEIIIVTAHTASATVATITRAAYGTATRAHPQGTMWMHTPIDEDYVEILTAGTRPSNPYEGQFIFETDTNKLVGYGGVDWAPRDAGGTLGYAQIVANQAGLTAPADITGLSVAVTVGTGRRVRISSQGVLLNTAAGDQTNLRIVEGGTVLQESVQRPAANVAITFVSSVILTPSAGAHTYKIQAGRDTGAGSVTFVASATIPGFILIEDIGAA